MAENQTRRRFRRGCNVSISTYADKKCIHGVWGHCCICRYGKINNNDEGGTKRSTQSDLNSIPLGYKLGVGTAGRDDLERN